MIMRVLLVILIGFQKPIYNLLLLSQENNDSSNIDLGKESAKILNKFKFYSLFQKSKLLNEAVTKHEMDQVLSEFDIQNKKLIIDFLDHINFLSNWDVKYTNSRLSLVNKNFDWDASYMLSVTSLPFFELANTSSE